MKKGWINNILKQDLLIVSPNKVRQTVSKLKEILNRSLDYDDVILITYDEAVIIDTQMRSILERLWRSSSDYCFARNLDEFETKFDKFKEQAMYEYHYLSNCECEIIYICKVKGKFYSCSCSCDIKETDIRSGFYTQVNTLKNECYYLDKFFLPYNYERLEYFMEQLDRLWCCQYRMRTFFSDRNYINEDMDGDDYKESWGFFASVYLDIIYEWERRSVKNKTTIFSDAWIDSYNIEQLFH